MISIIHKSFIKIGRFFCELFIKKVDKTRCNQFFLKELRNENYKKKAILSLNENSYFIIKNFLSKKEVNNLRDEIVKIYSNARFIDNKKIYDYIKKNKLAFVKRNDSFISKDNKKIYYDKNFVEILNYENNKKLEILEKAFSKKVSKFKLRELISISNKKQIKTEMNKIYIYDKVKYPRPFHFDTYKNSIKFFVALDEITSLEQGPYSIIPGTHKFKKLFKVMEFINLKFLKKSWFMKFDGSFFSDKYAIPFFTNFGDLIVTRQNAIHGDFPSHLNNRRIMVVKHFLFE